jgi:hypothetical protein
MKRLHYVLGLTIVGLASFLASCQYEPTAVGDGESVYGAKGGGSTSSAAPRIIFARDYTGNGGKKYSAIWVQDSDGTDITRIITYPTASSLNGYVLPYWSPSSMDFVYRESMGIATRNNTSLGVYKVNTGTVSVSNGVASATNLATLLQPVSGTDTFVYMAHAWSSTSSSEIFVSRRRAGWKYIDDTSSGNNLRPEILSVSTGGGSPTVIHTGNPRERFSAISVSPDGSKLAVSGSNQYANGIRPWYYIKIIDIATGAVEDSILGNWYGTGLRDWSRSGANKLLFNGVQYEGGSSTFHTYDLSTSSVTSYNDGSTAHSWSPANDILYAKPGADRPYIKRLHNNTTDSLPSGAGFGNWHR